MTGHQSSVSLTITVDNAKSLKNGGAFFSGLTKNKKRVQVVAFRKVMDFTPFRGETWKVEGFFVKHERFGKQLQASGIKLVKPEGYLVVKYLSESECITGLGPIRAQALWDRFGEKIFSLLDSDDQKETVNTITEAFRGTPNTIPYMTVVELYQHYREHKREIEVVNFLQENGFDRRIAKKILIWAKDDSNALEAIKKNPYVLIAFNTFNKVDALAQQMGVKPDDERRLVAAALHGIFGYYNQNHTAIPENKLKDRIGAAINASPLSSVVMKSIALVEEKSALRLDNNLLQGYGAFFMETTVVKQVKDLVALSNNDKQADMFGDELDYLDKYFDNFAKSNNGTVLTDLQKKAVKEAINNHISVVTGGAGTGKTTMLRALNGAVQLAGGECIFMALAGKAARRISELTGTDAITIASYLCKGIKKADKWNMIVIDEASMVDLPTAYRILKDFDPVNRICFVGDKNQLPPVGPGLVFDPMTESQILPVTRLSKVYRQKEGSGVIETANAILDRQLPPLSEYNGPDTGVFVYSCPAREIMLTSCEVYSELGGDDFSEDVRILTAVKNGVAGSRNINIVLHDEYGTDRYVFETKFRVGSQIIFTQNDYDRGLMNGSLGVITESFDKPIEITFGNPEQSIVAIAKADFNGESKFLTPIDFEGGLLAPVQLGYAFTVHKAQGSQFRRVIIPIIENKLLDQRLIYTAITRCIDQVVLIGDIEAIKTAVKDGNSRHGRDIGLKF